MDFAIIKTGGKQYRVRKGEELAVERLEGEVGSPVTFSEVLMTGGESDSATRVGKPLVEGASVKAEIVEQLRAEKILVFKKRRRKNSRRLQGHRQMLTRVRIQDISA